MLLHVATTYKSTENQTSQAQSQFIKIWKQVVTYITVLSYESLINSFGYVLRAKVILLQTKVAWAEPWAIWVTTQESAHATWVTLE